MSDDASNRGAWLAAGALAGLGIASRIAPLADAGGRLFRQFPTEDGYLMLTMSRNIALGRGMSIADGTIPTNGTQPLATFLYAAGFWLFDGDRASGVAVALLLQTAIASAALVLLYRLGLCAFEGRADRKPLAAFAAALWFAAPHTLRHSMNCLESGLYALCVIAVALAVTSGPTPRPAWGRWAGIGGLLGISFWARNDAVLLCAAVGLVHLGGLLPGSSPRWRDRVAELSVAAACTVAVVTPWIASNWLRFGHIVPVSGQAESLHAGFAENLAIVAPKLFEHMALLLPLPSRFEEEPLVIVGCALAAIAFGAAALRVARRGTPIQRGLVAVAAIYTVALALFYGLWFGAGHFMSRYLFPASPLLALALVGFVASAADRLPIAVGRPARTIALVTAFVLALGLHVRAYRKGVQHEHFQVVAWVEQHVPEDVWIGAIQTGTLGFFHDLTVNLDGKVNPAALEARRAERIPDYVVAGPIQYLIDWVGIAGWAEIPVLQPTFELILVDPERNLAVLRRRAQPLGSDG